MMVICCSIDRYAASFKYDLVAKILAVGKLDLHMLLLKAESGPASEVERKDVYTRNRKVDFFD